MAERSQLAANTNGVSRTTLSATLKLRSYQKPKNATDPIATPIGSRNASSTSISPRLPSASVRGDMAELRHSAFEIALDVTDDPQH